MSGLNPGARKITNPMIENDLRIISLTSFLSKVSEQFIISWLLKYVEGKIDWGQYGGTKGSSISHYLVELVILPSSAKVQV